MPPRALSRQSALILSILSKQFCLNGLNIREELQTSSTGHVTITVVQANGERFKTLARNVVIAM